MNTSNTRADELIREGLVASQSQQGEVALRLFRMAAESAPGSGIPHFLIGAELAQSGLMDEAEASYANAVLLSPELHMARYQLGLVQFTSNRAALALVSWGPLFELPAAMPLQRIVVGFAALAQDRFEEAAGCFNEALKLNTDNPALNKDLQMLLDRIATQHSVPKTPGLAEPDGAEHATDAESDSGHYLLANYHQQGPLH